MFHFSSDFVFVEDYLKVQKQPFGGVLKITSSANLQQIYRRTSMPKFYFNKVALQLAAYFLNTFF